MMKRLSARIPLLEKLLSRDRLNGELVRKVLGTIERDIAFLENESVLKRLTVEEKEKAGEIRKRAAESLKKVKEKLDGMESSGE